MARAFIEIAFTDSVKAAQSRFGSRTSYAKFDHDENRRDRLSEQEIAFIAERDSFYMGSVGENGWPYVQHRGGPKGFLKVLDEKTIGFADFRGNKQYISVGNLNADNRVSLFLMDYPNRQRLKLWARARIVHRDEDPGLVARLEVSAYNARVERGIVMTIAAFDWNCPQHITPRFSEAEIERLIAPLIEENRVLKAQLAQANAQKTVY
jgi:predicted pyridoxine 5'-phosphate oxidase superfamily flavin-nucleotide-binding protein